MVSAVSLLLAVAVALAVAYAADVKKQSFFSLSEQSVAEPRAPKFSASFEVCSR